MSTTEDQYAELDLEQFGENYAIISNGTKADHIVKTETFVSKPVVNYDGYTANIGDAEALCGHEAGGRMVPAEGNAIIAGVCGNCLRAARAGGDE